MTDRQKKVFPTQKQRAQIYEDLKAQLTVVGDNLVEYRDPNMTDQTIADRYSVTVASVRNTRLQIFGQLRKPEVPAGKIEDLEKQVALLTHTVGDLQARFEKLCGLLSLNRVVDVRKLVPINGTSSSIAPFTSIGDAAKNVVNKISPEKHQ